jgi:hypothetical protein
MKKQRKTVEISELIDFANKILSLPESVMVTKDYKEGICTVLEFSLKSANAYKGFYFIDNNNCELNTFGYYSRFYFKF